MCPSTVAQQICNGTHEHMIYGMYSLLMTPHTREVHLGAVYFNTCEQSYYVKSTQEKVCDESRDKEKRFMSKMLLMEGGSS